uniref:OTU1-like C-terminal C2H2-type zinc finger domain-containing protein n=1 Tax=Quercus lobata TaxID=97700 RepID=A0A7N2M8F0_QUELO
MDDCQVQRLGSRHLGNIELYRAYAVRTFSRFEHYSLLAQQNIRLSFAKKMCDIYGVSSYAVTPFSNPCSTDCFSNADSPFAQITLGCIASTTAVESVGPLDRKSASSHNPLPKSASSHNPLMVFHWSQLDAFAWKKLVLQSPLVSHKFVDQQTVKIILKLKRRFTDTANFTLRCGVCQIGVIGQKEAVEHAQATGHVNFQEYR